MLDNIKTSWESFKDKVIHKQAPEMQIKEMQLAFYAGCLAMQNIQWKIADHNITEAEGEAHLLLLNNEVNSFFNQKH